MCSIQRGWARDRCPHVASQGPAAQCLFLNPTLEGSDIVVCVTLPHACIRALTGLGMVDCGTKFCLWVSEQGGCMGHSLNWLALRFTAPDWPLTSREAVWHSLFPSCVYSCGGWNPRTTRGVPAGSPGGFRKEEPRCQRILTS